MPSSSENKPIHATRQCHAKSSFKDVDLEGSMFDDVNLRHSTFNNIALTGSTFHDVCMADVKIDDANLVGMTLNGILVTELLRVYDEHAQSRK